MERQTLQIAAGLCASGAWEVHVASLQCGGPLGAELGELGFTDIPCFPLGNLYGPGAAWQLLRLAGLLRRRRIEIVHAHDFYTNVLGLSAARLAAVPVRIASRRELDVFTPQQRRVEHLVYRWASAVLANCAFLRNRLVLEGVPEEKALMLPNAVLPSRVACADPGAPARLRSELGIPAAAPVITMLANLYNRQKDLSTFVRAASAVTRSHPAAVFVLGGGGDARAVHGAAVECQPRPRLLTPGSLPEIGPLLAVSDVSVLASFSEGASNAVLEAMAAGKPVVATAVGGTPELVQDGITGWLVPPSDAEALATRIRELLHDAVRARQMGERGRAFVLARFSAERQVMKLTKIYQALLSARMRVLSPVVGRN
jgi:L-malate glycosyltransferase